jgi:hypothetical protein
VLAALVQPARPPQPGRRAGPGRTSPAPCFGTQNPPSYVPSA